MHGQYNEPTKEPDALTTCTPTHLCHVNELRSVDFIPKTSKYILQQAVGGLLFFSFLKKAALGKICSVQKRGKEI